MIGVGLLAAVLALFLPWWSWDFFSLDAPSRSGSANGFSGWGIPYLVFTLATSSFLFIRTVGADGIRPLDLPFQDWLAYVFGGALMGFSSLSVWGSQNVPNRIPLNMEAGWWLSLAASIVVIVGGVLKRDAAQPFKT